MRTCGNIRLGRICKLHPELNGRRYVANNNCTECCKERGRKVYAALDLTPSQKITTLLAERDQLKAENERLKMELECAQLNLSIAVGVKNSQQDELREAQAENERLREDDVRFIALMAQEEQS